VFEVDIPGFGLVRLEHLVSDFTGTLSWDGKLLPSLKNQLNKVAEFLKVHILTADTFGMAQSELKGVDCVIRILSGQEHDIQKEKYVITLGAENVVALGNGNNDRKMLKAARIGVAVTGHEGCSVDAIMAANIHVASPQDGLNLLINSKRLKATLRF